MFLKHNALASMVAGLAVALFALLLAGGGVLSVLRAQELASWTEAQGTADKLVESSSGSGDRPDRKWVAFISFETTAGQPITIDRQVASLDWGDIRDELTRTASSSPGPRGGETISHTVESSKTSRGVETRHIRDQKVSDSQVDAEYDRRLAKIQRKLKARKDS